MSEEFPDVDFSTLDSVWPDKTSPAGWQYAHTREDVLKRAKLCINDLYHRPESLLFVVTHLGFLRLGVVGWWFFNSDYRIFNFESQSEEPGFKLIQDEATLRGGLGLSRRERCELGSELPRGKPERSK